MKAIKLFAEWAPKGKIGQRGIKDKRAQEGCQIWKNPRVELVDAPIPEIGPTEVLIKVKKIGICGSDILMNWPGEDGYTRYSYIMSNGVIIGHEFSGEIVKIGDRIDEFQKQTAKEIFKLGTPVTAQCVINCGICEACKNGDFDDCLFNEEKGFSVDGAMAEYTKADIRHIFSLENLKENYPNPDLLYSAGALIEPLAGVYKAIFNIGKGLAPGENAVVIGGGPIGLAAVALLKTAGAAAVILSEPSKARGEIAKKLGADYVINPLENDFKQKVLELTKGQGAKIYFEAAGIGPKIYSDIDWLFQHGQPNAKFIMFGHGPGDIKLFPETLIGHYNVLTGSHGHCGVWPQVINLIANKKIEPQKMITKEITLSEIPQCLEMLRTNKEEGKVIIKI